MAHGACHQGREGAVAQRRVPSASDSGWSAPRRPGISAASSRCGAGRPTATLHEAAGLSDPVPAVEPTVAITFKLPVSSTVRAIRAYARRSGLSLGQVVTQAVTALLDSIRQRRG